MKRLIISVLCSVAFAPAAYASTADCKSALILSTYKSSSAKFHDARLAIFVTQSEYDQAKKEGGVSAVIYGVPVGASYSDFSERATQMGSASASSLTEAQALNVMWTGLSDASSTAYSNCLAATAGSERGVHLSVRYATVNDISVLVQYSPQGNDPVPMRVSWQTLAHANTALPNYINAGSSTVLFRRPSSTRQVVIQGLGTSDAVVLTPLPIYIPLPPPQPFQDTDFKLIAGAQPPTCDSSGSPSPLQAPLQKNGLYNLALLRGATASASSLLPGFPLRHTVENISDGWYNNCRSWIPSALPAYAQVDLGAIYTISLIAFGSEFQPYYNDRAIDQFSISVTANGSDWQTVYASASGEVVTGRKEFPIPPQQVRYVRVNISHSTSDLPRIDELEIYGRR